MMKKEYWWKEIGFHILNNDYNIMYALSKLWNIFYVIDIL